MGSRNVLTVGMIIGIAIAIIMSGAALTMLVTLNDKISSITEHEATENLEVGAPGVGKNEYYVGDGWIQCLEWILEEDKKK